MSVIHSHAVDSHLVGQTGLDSILRTFAMVVLADVPKLESPYSAPQW